MRQKPKSLYSSQRAGHLKALKRSYRAVSVKAEDTTKTKKAGKY